MQISVYSWLVEICKDKEISHGLQSEKCFEIITNVLPREIMLQTLFRVNCVDLNDIFDYLYLLHGGRQFIKQFKTHHVEISMHNLGST